MTSSIQCTICLSALNVKEDVVHVTNCGHAFHHNPCLTGALRMSRSCPHCRKPNVQHFQLFFEVGNDEETAGAAGVSKDAEFLSKQISQISKKLDNLSATMTPPRTTLRNQQMPAPDQGMYLELVAQLQRENQDLREILEMEKILSTNAEKEIEQLKLEVRERNDLINALQMQNDALRDEADLYGIPRASASRVPTDNLLNL